MHQLEPNISQLLSIQKRYVTRLMDMDIDTTYKEWPKFHTVHKDGFCTFPKISSLDSQLPEPQACTQGWSIYQMQTAFLESEWPSTFRLQTAEHWTKELLTSPKPKYSKFTFQYMVQSMD